MPARRWPGWSENGVADPYGRVVALTASPDKAVEWGVDETRVLPFPESVGGRYSLWSSIGFPIALALGWEEFAQFLDGAAAMDRHFLRERRRSTTCRCARPLPISITPACAAARPAPALPMTSGCGCCRAISSSWRWNRTARSVTADGAPVDGPTAPITWGGVGTDAQHAVFQLLHQGTNLVPVDFIAAIAPGDELDPAHHRILLANCFAQGAALMAGKDSKDPARAYPGDRPSRDDPVRRSRSRHAGRADRVPRTPHLCQCGADGDQSVRPVRRGTGQGDRQVDRQGRRRRFDASTEALLAAAGIELTLCVNTSDRLAIVARSTGARP